MFGKIVKSKSAIAGLTAAALASVLLVPAAMAQQNLSAGNSFEIPSDTNAYYSPQPLQPSAPATIRHHQSPVVERSTTNPNCQSGYSWNDSLAGNGMSMPTPGHG